MTKAKKEEVVVKDTKVEEPEEPEVEEPEEPEVEEPEEPEVEEPEAKKPEYDYRYVASDIPGFGVKLSVIERNDGKVLTPNHGAEWDEYTRWLVENDPLEPGAPF